MDGLKQTLERMYLAKLGNETIRQIVLPVAAGPTLTAGGAGSTYGVWADIALLATVTLPSLIVAVQVCHASANDEYTIQIGTTLSLGVNWLTAALVEAEGAATILAAGRQEIGVHCSAATTPDYVVPLYTPIVVHPGEGIIGRCYGITVAAVTICVRVMLLQRY